MIRSITTEKGAVTYELQRKKVKNFNLRIRSDGTVFVSVPNRVSLTKADEFVKNHIDFILKNQRRITENNRKTKSQPYFLGEAIKTEIKQGEKALAQLLGDTLTIYLPHSALTLPEEERKKLIGDITVLWQKRMGAEVFPEYLEKAHLRFQRAGLSVPYPAISVKSMKTRWGSCTPGKKKITLNCSLTEKDPSCIEYVICHELAHFLQQNHSERFYAILDKVMPEHRELRRALNNK